jgi:hypothetical protein
MNHESPEDDPSVIETSSEYTTTSNYSDIMLLFVVWTVISYTLLTTTLKRTDKLIQVRFCKVNTTRRPYHRCW